MALSQAQIAERQKYRKRVDNLLARVYNLQVTTGADVCCLILWDGDIHQYCSEAFDPLLNHTGDTDGGPEGRKVIAKLLMGKRQGKESETPSRPIPDGVIEKDIIDPGEDKYLHDVDTESSQFIENVEQREKHFKETVANLLVECENLSILKKPSQGIEIMLLVATPSRRVISWATPKLEPLYKSEQGGTLVKSILFTAHTDPSEVTASTEKKS